VEGTEAAVLDADDRKAVQNIKAEIDSDDEEEYTKDFDAFVDV
jgi:hypothetical protein